MAEDFSGAGSAWFAISELAAFGRALLDSFPLAPDAVLKLEGGGWSNVAGQPFVRELSLKVYPVGTMGHLGIAIQLATPMATNQRPESRRSVALELMTDYESLRVFGIALCAMAGGTTQEAVLNGWDWG